MNSKKTPLEKSPNKDLWLAASLDVLDTLEVDPLVLLISSDVRPLRGAAGFADWRLCGRVSQTLLAGHINGTLGEKLLMPTWQRILAPRVLLLGCGTKERMQKNMPAILEILNQTLAELKVKKAAVALPEGTHNLSLQFENWAQSTALAIQFFATA